MLSSYKVEFYGVNIDKDIISNSFFVTGTISDVRGASFLTGSKRQPSGNIINSNGSTDRAIGNTNTYGIAPHDAGIGGAWIFAGNGGDGGGNFNTGFDADYNNVSWQSRYSYWFVK